MKLVYTGPHAEVEVPDAGIIATRDVAVDVKDDVAATLLAQDTWGKADKPETDAEKKARETAEKQKAEQDAAAKKAAAEAVAKVKAEQAAAEKAGN